METDDECLTCPYNTSHIISAVRMPYHLIKCRKNYPSVELVVCPYNANHEVNKPELKHHMLNCPSRVLLEREITFESVRKAIKDPEPPMKKGFTDLPRYRDHHVDDDNDENWDTDNNQGFMLQPSRRSQHRREDENISLRRPFNHTIAEVMESSGADHSDTSSPGPHNSFSFNALLLGRGRARPALSPDRDLSTTTLTSGQSHVLQPNNMPSLLMTKPGLSDITWAIGRGRGSSFKYQ